MLLANVLSLQLRCVVSQIVYESPPRPKINNGLGSGATTVVAERGEEGLPRSVKSLGGGADAALECVGTEASAEQALGVLHNGGAHGICGRSSLR